MLNLWERLKEKRREWEREIEGEKWGGLSSAVTWNSCFSVVRWRWILAHFLSILPLCLSASSPCSEGRGPASSLMRETKSIWLSDQSKRKTLKKRSVFSRRVQPCKCWTLQILFSQRSWQKQDILRVYFFNDLFPSRWNRGSSEAVLTLLIWHSAQSLSWARF